jgi:SSS family transporter
MYDPLLYLGFFVFYTILILIFGRHGFDRSHTLKDYFIANQGLGTWSSVSTFGATWFSAVSMLGFTGLIYTHGYSTILLTAVCWFLGASILFLMIDKLYDFGAVTVPEFLRMRYQSLMLQVLAGIILLFSYILYLVIQIQGFGIVIGELLDVPYTVAVFLIYIFIIYTTFGGLYSVARTDSLNFIFILLGTVIAALLVLNELGGIASLHRSIVETNNAALFDPFPNGTWTFVVFISSFFSLGLGLAANPQYVVRIWSAKDKGTAYRMISISIVVLAIAYTSLAIVGMGAKILVPDGTVSHNDQIFPYMMSEFISSPLKGIILVGIIAASISTANSQLLLIASSSVYDIYQNVRKKRTSEYKLVLYTRVLVVLLLTCSLLISLTSFKELVAFSGQIWGGSQLASFSLCLVVFTINMRVKRERSDLF